MIERITIGRLCRSTVVFLLCLVFVAAQRQSVQADITPIPMDDLNPHLTEFRRIDSNNDEYITFSEYLLSDRPYIESQSRHFHDLDVNGDGKVARQEFEQYYRSRDEEHRQHRLHADMFFKQFGTDLYDDGNGPPVVFNLPSQLFHLTASNERPTPSERVKPTVPPKVNTSR